MTYQLLSAPYVQQFTEVFDKAFGRVPDLKNMTAMLAIDDNGVIKGFSCLYAVTVADSMWVSPEYRHKGVWRKMCEAVINLPWKKGEGFYFYVTRKREEALAKLFGASKLPYSLWRKKY